VRFSVDTRHAHAALEEPLALTTAAVIVTVAAVAGAVANSATVLGAVSAVCAWAIVCPDRQAHALLVPTFLHQAAEDSVGTAATVTATTTATLGNRQAPGGGGLQACAERAVVKDDWPTYRGFNRCVRRRKGFNR
jgi:hypothetical protein